MRRELDQIVRRRGWAVEVQYLPPELHISPADLTQALGDRLARLRGQYDRIIVVYGRCAPDLDQLLEAFGAERVDGEHCYEIFGDEDFMALLKEQPGTYFLTDFLCRNFFSRAVPGLGLDRYPQLKQVFFRNYTRVVYLDTQTDGSLDDKARDIANYLGLPLLIVRVGTRGLERRLARTLEREP
jgi:hypothetical protein